MPESQPLDVKIVPAGEGDLPEISRLAGVVWRAHYPGIITLEQIEYMLGRMYSPEMLREDIRVRGIRYDRLLVGNDFAGFAAYGPTEQPAVFKLHKIYLRPDCQGRGLGSRLLNHCAAEAARAGAQRVILAVNKRNAKALAAYQRNGFVIIDSVVVDIGGGFVMDDYILAKDVTRNFKI